ncbi:hypothetical protein Tco_1221618 [Tanacetum coccineum]
MSPPYSPTPQRYTVTSSSYTLLPKHFEAGLSQEAQRNQRDGELLSVSPSHKTRHLVFISPKDSSTCKSNTSALNRAFNCYKAPTRDTREAIVVPESGRANFVIKHGLHNSLSRTISSSVMTKRLFELTPQVVTFWTKAADCSKHHREQVQSSSLPKQKPLLLKELMMRHVDPRVELRLLEAILNTIDELRGRSTWTYLPTSNMHFWRVTNKLPVIIAKDLSVWEKAALIKVL